MFIVLVTAVDSGLPLVVSKLTAKYRLKQDLGAESRVVSASLSIGLFFSLVICLLIFILQKPLTNIFNEKQVATVLLVLCPAIIATSVHAGARGSLWGQQKHFIVSLCDFLEQLIRLVLVFFLLDISTFKISGEISASIALSVSCLVSALICVIYYLKSGATLKKPYLQDYKNVLKTSLPITGVRVVSSLVQPLIAFLIPLRLIASGYTQAQALRQLGIILGMTYPLLFLPTTLVGSLSTALIPELSSLMQQKKQDKMSSQINSALLFCLFVSFLFVPVFIGLGVPIGKFLFKNATSGVYLSICAFLVVPISLSGISASILNALGMEIKSCKNYILGSILLIFSLWFLPKYVGVNALTVGMATCMGIVSILNIKMIKTVIPLNIKFVKRLILLFLLVIPCSLLARWSYNILEIVFPNFVALTLSASMCIVAYFVLSNVFNLVEVNWWFLKVKLLKILKLDKKAKRANI